MTFTAEGPLVWPRPADWGSSVRESLAWLTDVLQSGATGVTQHRALRITPRRSFAFTAIASEQERRVLDTLLAAAGARRWLLPIWPDEQYLTAPVAAGAVSIACHTVGYDFVVGGKALLWSGINTWELVDVLAVNPAGLELGTPTARAWRRGARLYPLRWARIQTAQASTITDTLDRYQVTMLVDEPCDWAAAPPATLYLGHPVLEVRPDFAADGQVAYSYLQATQDNATAPAWSADIAGISSRGARSNWELWGRAQQAAFRGLLYALCGRSRPIWIPSWQQDLRLAEPATAGASELIVEWAGYTLHGQRPERRDLAIALQDGTVRYRRITGAAEIFDADGVPVAERLTLSASLGAPATVRCISFLSLCTLGSDQIDIEYISGGDGRATSVTPWAQVVADV